RPKIERKTRSVLLGLPLGRPYSSGGSTPEADALSTELQVRIRVAASRNAIRKSWRFELAAVRVTRAEVVWHRPDTRPAGSRCHVAGISCEAPTSGADSSPMSAQGMLFERIAAARAADTVTGRLRDRL